jgi:rhamnulokinase/L-fuculokinase
MKALAFDFGASSGRAILGIYDGKELKTEEIHRFSNDPVTVNGTFYWDVLRLFFEMKQSFAKCVAMGHSDIDTIAIDTWGVDFGLLDKDGRLLDNPIHYRDTHSIGMPEKIFKVYDKQKMYDKTGIEFMNINTLFQLCSLKEKRPELLERAKTLLFMPDLLSYFLTGEKNVEYTIASTSQMLNARERRFDEEMLSDLGLDASILPEIVMPGAVRGKLSQELADEFGIARADVIATASHDTAAAIAATPIREDEKACFISCGTWSLLGAELAEPLINERSFAENFTNEGGAEGKIELLKNICGLWLLQETRRQWNREGCDVSFKDIDNMLLTEKSANVYIDPDYAPFSQPGNLPARINEFLEKTGQIPLTSKGQTALCILESLALTYRYYIEALENILGYTLDTVHLIGGGVKDKNLCKFTANATGKRVVVGPVEATATGNITIQLMAKGEVKDIAQARTIQTEKLETYLPENGEEWNEKYKNYLKYKGVL